jgi:hypothetical protein
MRVVTREEFGRIFLNASYSFEEKLDLVREDFKLEIPPEIRNAEDLLEYVYDKYIKTMELYHLQEERKFRKEKSSRKKAEGTVKEWIVNFIFDHKKVSYSDLFSAVDDQFGYSQNGKSPRTRIKNVLKELTALNQVKYDHNLIEVR